MIDDDVRRKTFMGKMSMKDGVKLGISEEFPQYH